MSIDLDIDVLNFASKRKVFSTGSRMLDTEFLYLNVSKAPQFRGAILAVKWRLRTSLPYHVVAVDQIVRPSLSQQSRLVISPLVSETCVLPA